MEISARNFYLFCHKKISNFCFSHFHKHFPYFPSSEIQILHIFHCYFSSVYPPICRKQTNDNAQIYIKRVEAAIFAETLEQSDYILSVWLLGGRVGMLIF